MSSTGTTGSTHVRIRETFQQNVVAGCIAGPLLGVLWYVAAGWPAALIWLTFPFWSWYPRSRINVIELTPTQLIIRRGFRKTTALARTDIVWIRPVKAGVVTRVWVQDRNGVDCQLPVPFTAWWTADRDFDARVRQIGTWFEATQ